MGSIALTPKFPLRNEAGEYYPHSMLPTGNEAGEYCPHYMLPAGNEAGEYCPHSMLPSGNEAGEYCPHSMLPAGNEAGEYCLQFHATYCWGYGLSITLVSGSDAIHMLSTKRYFEL